MKKIFQSVKEAYPLILFVGGLITYIILKYTSKIP